MGVQIYIKKSAINVLSTDEVTLATGCECNSDTQYGYCMDCGSLAEDLVVKYCEVEGLDMLMNDFGDLVYHDANSWGRNRQPLLDFIRERGISDDDWYEG